MPGSPVQRPYCKSWSVYPYSGMLNHVLVKILEGNLDAKNCWKRCRSRTASEPAKDAAASDVKLPVGTHTVLDDTLLCRFCLATPLTRSLKKTTFFLKFRSEPK